MDLLAALFTWVSSMLTQNPAIVISVSFIWGVLSVILSPCHLSSIPLAVGYINGKGKMKHTRALFLSLFFAIGILLSLLVLGIITSLIGRMLGDVGKITIIIVGVVFIMVGISLFDFVRLPEIPIWKTKVKPGKLFGAFTLGLLFGAALGPCTFGFMMPVLAVAFQTATTNLLYAIMIILAYAIGHSLVIVCAGTFINWVQNLLNWEEKSRGVVYFRRICGVLIIISGVYLILSK
jgi:cytochrome c-type biogenesis protein